MPTPNDVVSVVTRNQFRRGAWANATQNSPTLGILTQKGRVNTYDAGGDRVEWKVEAGLYNSYTVGDYEDNISKFVPSKRHATATLDWGIKMTPDAMSKHSLKKNRGEAAAVNIAKDRLPKMMRAMLSQGGGDATGVGSLNYEFLRRDGGSAYTGDGLPLQGLPTVFKFDTGLATSAQQASVTSGATYAGLSLEANGLTGLTNGDANAWTPKGFNVAYDWDGTGGSSTTLTAAHFPKIFDYAQIELDYGRGDEFAPSCVIHGFSHFNVGRDYISSLQQIDISRPGKGDEEWGTGSSRDRFWHSGIWHYKDADMNTAESYITNFDQVELTYLPALEAISGDKNPGGKSMGDLEGLPASMIDCEAQYNPGRDGIILRVGCDAQFLINPKYQGLVKDFS